LGEGGTKEVKSYKKKKRVREGRDPSGGKIKTNKCWKVEGYKTSWWKIEITSSHHEGEGKEGLVKGRINQKVRRHPY